MPRPALQLTEVLCALSSATDLANGNPLDTTLRTCTLAVELAREAALEEETVGDVFYAALLRYIGCTAYAPEEARLGGDDIAFKQLYGAIDPRRKARAVAATVTKLGAGGGALNRVRAVAGALKNPAALTRQLATAGCEVGQRLATRLGMTAGVVTALDQIHERWDGSGAPAHLEGEQLSPVARVMHVAVVAEQALRLGGVTSAVAEVKVRGGRHLDPKLARLFGQGAARILGAVEASSAWTAALERAPQRTLASEVEDIASAFADFVDLKSPFLLGHSSGVAELAVAAAPHCGLDATATTLLRHAALLHDLGRVGVPTGIWDKAEPLDPGEWDRVHLHAHDTGRILGRSAALAAVAEIAAAHHERLDGSGYPRRAAAGQLTMASRLLAAADAYQALGSDRAHRPRYDRLRARELLEREAREGRLDRRAVAGVLDAAGERIRGRKTLWPAGLTDREVQVLRRLVRGESNKEIAAHFDLSPRTVGHHALHIYTKIGVSSRAAAALFAIENGLLASDDAA